jgi:ribosomal protein L7Ae-like RNA K-turn-binding protein
MTNEQKLLNLLGLAKRAGKLITGEELVIKSIQMEKARLVFIASDASENTKKKISDKATYYEVPFTMSFDTDTLSHAIGANRKAVAISDSGFAKKMESLMN